MSKFVITLLQIYEKNLMGNFLYVLCCVCANKWSMYIGEIVEFWSNIVNKWLMWIIMVNFVSA